MPPIRYDRDDFVLRIGWGNAFEYPVAAQWENREAEGLFPLDPGQVADLGRDWIHGGPALEAQVARTLYEALIQALPELESWLAATWGLDFSVTHDPESGEGQVRYWLPRLRLHFDSRELVPLPWEAMVEHWNKTLIVVRGSTQRMAIAGKEVDLPLQFAQAGDLCPGRGEPFRLRERVEEVFSGRSRPYMEKVLQTDWAPSLSGIIAGRGRTDLLHLAVQSINEWEDRGPLGGSIELCGGATIGNKELAEWLIEERTRLLVLQQAGRTPAVTAGLMHLAHDLADIGGPPVLIGPFEDNVESDRFFSQFYDQLIHDTPIDFAQLLLYPGDYPPRPAPEQTWLHAHLPLVTGRGGENLLRISPLLLEIADHRQALADKAGRELRRAGELYDQLLAAEFAKGGSFEGLMGPPVGPPVDDRLMTLLEGQKGKLQEIGLQLEEMQDALLFDSRHEYDSSIPMVRSRDELERLHGDLEAAASEMQDALAERAQRYVNTWFVEGQSANEGRDIEPAETLDLDKQYLLHVDIGPRPARSKSIVTRPVDLGEVLEQLYDLHDDQGVTLEVALFSLDFWVERARQEPQVAHEVWRQPRDQHPVVDYWWQRPDQDSVVDYVWLSRLSPSRPLYFALQARHAGLCRLRLCVYHKNNLLQSLLLEARVMEAGSVSDLSQIPDLDPQQAERLMAAGFKDLSALPMGDPVQLASIAGATDAQAQRWIEAAVELQRLGNRGRVEYTTTADFGTAQRAPERTLSLFTNRSGDTHMIGVKVGGWDEEGGDGDDWAFPLALDEKTLKDILTAARHDLTEASSILVDGVPSEYYYDEETNEGTPQQLGAALYRLAVQGWRMYSAFFKEQTVIDTLRARLEEEKRTIHVARLVGTYAIPWSLMYDRGLAYEQKWKPKYVCLHALQHLAEGKCEGCPGGDPATLEGAHRVQALEKGPDGVDVYVYEDTSLCALAAVDEGEEDQVVCPWGFWGFKHLLEQPPQRLRGEEPAPRDLKTEIRVTGQPVLNMNVSTTLDFVKDGTHRQRLAALQHGGEALLTMKYAGEDELDPAGSIARWGIEEVLRAMAASDLSLIYFYCHGGAVRDRENDPLEAFLSVGGSDEQQLRPSTLVREGYLWQNAPLVFINACKSAELEPGLLDNFVQTFAERGAAGVLGTEVWIWENLAVEAAEFFIQELFKEPAPGGEWPTVGEVLLALRRRLLQKYNPLGLVYTNYCSSDLSVKMVSN